MCFAVCVVKNANSDCTMLFGGRQHNHENNDNPTVTEIVKWRMLAGWLWPGVGAGANTQSKHHIGTGVDLERAQ